MDEHLSFSSNIAKTRVSPLVILYIVVFLIARTGQLSSVFTSGCLFLGLVLVFVSKKEHGLMCLFFTCFISDNMILVGGVSYEAVLDIIVLIKYCKLEMERKSFLAVLIIIFGQIISIITYNNSIMNVLSLAVRMLLMVYIIYDDSVISFRELIPHIAMLSVTSGAIIGLLFYSPKYEWQRFSGLWNDDNFCGMYCLVAMILSFYLIINKSKLRNAIPLVCLTICTYTATKTWSRSFIFITCAVFALFLFCMLHNKEMNPSLKFIVIAFCIIGFGLIANYSFSVIIEQRGLTYTASDSDWTHGRLELTGNALKVVFNDIKAFLFGSGVNNVPSMVAANGYTAMATHNTFADFVVQFGVPIGVLNYFILGTVLRKGVLSNCEKDGSFWVFIIVLLYGACLTLTQYTIFYISLGFFINRIVFTQEREFLMC